MDLVGRSTTSMFSFCNWSPIELSFLFTSLLSNCSGSLSLSEVSVYHSKLLQSPDTSNTNPDFVYKMLQNSLLPSRSSPKFPGPICFPTSKLGSAINTDELPDLIPAGWVPRLYKNPKCEYTRFFTETLNSPFLSVCQKNTSLNLLLKVNTGRQSVCERWRLVQGTVLLTLA